MKRLLFLLFLILVLSSLVFGESEKKLTVAVSSSDFTYNPIHSYTASEAQLYTALYEGLVSYDPLTLLPIPGTASTWKLSDDKKTYRFFIRENAFYWDGTKVTAADFRNTWIKLLDPAEKAEYSFLLDSIVGAKEYRTGKLTDKEELGIKVISDSILEVTLTHPAGHFLKILCHHSFVPMHPDFLHVRDWKALSSIPGNGPYYITSRGEEELILKKNELYWDEKKVEITDITILLSDDAEKTTSLFNEETIQWATSGIILANIRDRESIVTNPMFATNYFFFSCAEDPWSNPLVRKGLTHLLPWKEIRSDQVLFIPTSTLVPQIPQYPEVDGISKQDIEKGMNYLAEAGFPRGEGLKPIIIKIPPDFESQRVAALMKNAWQDKLETSVEIKEIGFPAYYEELKGTDYTLGTITWIGDFADPLTFLQMWTTDSNLNDARYFNQDFETIIRQSMSEGGETRYKTLSEAEDFLLSDGVVLPVSHQPAWNVIDLSVIGGWYPNPLDIHPFKFLNFLEQKLPRGIAGITQCAAEPQTIPH